MQLRFFSISARDPAAAEAQLNALLAAGRVAGLVRERVRSAEAMGRIDGIGPARVERYAAIFLPVLAESAAGPGA
jgi:hypothetical protein